MIITKQNYDLGGCYECFIQAFGLTTKWILDLWSMLLSTFLREKYPKSSWTPINLISLRENYSQISWTPINFIACNHGENDKELYYDEGAVLHFEIGLLRGHWYFVVNCVVHWLVVTCGPLSGLPLGVNRHCNSDPLSHRSSTMSTWDPLCTRRIIFFAWKDTFVISYDDL